MKEGSAKKAEKFIKWFSEIHKEDVPTVGGKGANLGEIYNLKINVPPGFVVTTSAYNHFLIKAGIKEKIKEIVKSINYEDLEDLEKKTKNIRELMIHSKIPKEIEEEISDAYNALDTRDFNFESGTALTILKRSAEPIFVAIRSSATAEDLANASFAGQQDSFLNIKGYNEVIENVKKTFASLYTARATYYRKKQNYTKEARLAAIVQRMIDSKKSGVVFSQNPSYEDKNVIVESVWGLGEGIVSGTITPDHYVVSRDLKIIEEKISNKKIAITRGSNGKEKIVQLSPSVSKKKVLKDSEIKSLTETSLKLEEHYQKPQDTEFAIEGEEIYIVQTRAITTLKKRLKEDEKKTISGDEILSGVGASPGIGSGKVKIVRSIKDLEKIEKGDVLVTKMTNPDMVVTMQKTSAIITDEGGLTAHAAIVSREMGIPSIVGTENATKILKENMVVSVDGYTGKVYLGKIQGVKKEEVLPITAKTKTEIKILLDLPSSAERAAKTKAKFVGLTRIEGIIAESGMHPDYFLKNGKIKDYEDIIFKGLNTIAHHFEGMWVRSSDVRSDEYKELKGAPKEVEENPMLGMHGIRFGLKEPEILKAEIRAMERVSQKGKKIGLLIPQVISTDEVKKVKGILKELNIKNLKFGVMIETPAAVQLIGALCKLGIDFISFGTNDLTQYILAIDRGNEEVQYLYDEMHPAVLKELEYVIRVCKNNKVKTSICGQAGSKKPMVKFLVERGIDSLSVNVDVAHEISEYVAELERIKNRSSDKEPRKYHAKNFSRR